MRHRHRRALVESGGASLKASSSTPTSTRCSNTAGASRASATWRRPPGWRCAKTSRTTPRPGSHGWAAKSEARCRACIGSRLRRAAEEAAAGGFGAFSTSLAVSPWQDHDAIREEGAAAGAEHGVEFLYQDLRPLFGASRRMARDRGLYRQKYCGCLLSEWERYREP